MGIRETLNEKPAIATGATVAIIVLAIGAIIWQLNGGGMGENGGFSKAFFTADDGATFFVDNNEKIPPFQKNGKTILGCAVFTADGGKTKFVGYVERYTPEMKQKLEDLRGKKQAMDPATMDTLQQQGGREVKPPRTGDNGWVKRNDPAAVAVLNPSSPDGKTVGVEAVPPE